MQNVQDRQTDALQAIASSLNVSPRVHDADYIFRWILDGPVKMDALAVAREYLEGGAQTAGLIRDLIGNFRSTTAPFTMLEFASGYGRVTRHWGNAIPAASVVACDIHEQAVSFLRELGLHASVSCPVPEELGVVETFDVVVALSFFKHMPRATRGRWLQALASRLTPSGLLIFTTHGLASLPHMGVTSLDKDGYWFGSFSEQKDLSTAEYGVTATSFDFVYRQFSHCRLALRYFREAGMGYQDLYVAAPCPGTVRTAG
jgi:SAM-dependent methyltransferase